MATKTPTVSKIMIIRHAEKPLGSDQGVMPDGTQSQEALIVQGWQRSGGLVTLFDPARGPLQSTELATPGMILASWESATKGSQRPYQTVAALAQQLGLDSSHFVTFDRSDIKGVVAAAIEATGTVLICWQHEDFPSIAETIARKTALPVTPTPPSVWPPPSWPGSRYDLVWVFDVIGSSPPTSWTFTQVPQLLLPGDSSTVIT
jgi:hypothetical protein